MTCGYSDICLLQNATTIYSAWYHWWTCADKGEIHPPAGQTTADPFENALQFLKDNQTNVQQNLPAQSSTWGWLVAQGNLIAANKPASITESAWMGQFKTFFQALQSAEIAAHNVCGGCRNPPSPGIYWTGLFILAGMIGAAVMIGKVKS